MGDILQMMFFQVFSWMKVCLFLFKVRGTLFRRLNCQHVSIGSGSGLALNRQQTVNWTQCWLRCLTPYHYNDVIMCAIASQITSLTIDYSIVYSDADQYQSSASLAFVRGIHRDRWIPHRNGQLRGKCFHLMTSSCDVITSQWVD